MQNIKILIGFLSLFILAACGNDELENKLAQLNEENNELKQQLNSQEGEADEAIGSFVEAFNEIQDNLNAIKEKEKLLTVQAGNPEFEMNEKERILNDIQSINELIQKNKKTISALRGKLRNSDAKVEELEEFVRNLSAQIQEKEMQIADLEIELSNMNDQMKVLFKEYNDRVAELDDATDALNTAYYCFGTSKELRDNGVVTKEGGFIGIGKIEKLKDDFNQKYFTQINIKETDEISLNVKEAEIITSHPSGSYKILGDDMVDKIVITNPEEFWKSSKYLVIIVEN